VPTKYPCNLATSLSHLPATPAFVISNVMRSSPAVVSLAELLDQMLAQGSIEGASLVPKPPNPPNPSNLTVPPPRVGGTIDGESYLRLLWRALEVVSVMIDNEDAKAGKTPAKGGKLADLSPLQNCLIGIVSKTRLGGRDGDDDEEDDEIEVDDDVLTAGVVHKLADGLLKQSMGGGDIDVELEVSA
jgi:hypothetical protein